MHVTNLNGTNSQTPSRNKYTTGLKKTAIGGAVLDGGLEFVFRRMENPDENMLVSLGAAGATAAAWMYFAPIMWAKTGVEVASSLGKAAANAERANYAKQLSVGQANFGGNFMDDQFSATTRQRAVNAIQSSKINARSFLGQEARALHRY